MLSRLIDLLSAKANILVLALAILASGNVVLQMITHKTTALTAWKGGGFGMYTEAHPDSRSVWLTFYGAEDVARLRLWPEADSMAEWRGEVSLKGDHALGKLTTMAARLRFYPRKDEARKILALAKQMRWKQNLTGGISPIKGVTFSADALSLEVFENTYDIKAQKLHRVPVFGLKGGAGS